MSRVRDRTKEFVNWSPILEELAHWHRVEVNRPRHMTLNEARLKLEYLARGRGFELDCFHAAGHLIMWRKGTEN